MLMAVGSTVILLLVSPEVAWHLQRELLGYFALFGFQRASP